MRETKRLSHSQSESNIWHGGGVGKFYDFTQSCLIADRSFLRSITSDFPPFLPPGNEAVTLDPGAIVQAITKTLSS